MKLPILKYSNDKEKEWAFCELYKFGFTRYWRDFNPDPEYIFLSIGRSKNIIFRIKFINIDDYYLTNSPKHFINHIRKNFTI